MLMIAALPCLLLTACQEDGPDDSSEPSTDTGTPQEQREPPPYSLGECPVLGDGVQDFASGESSYGVEVVLPEQPEGAPVLFAWHWLGGSGSDILRYLELRTLADTEGVIVIAPDSDGYLYEWRFSMPAEDNPDLLLFEDLLACAHATWSVDLDRVYATGMSAGGLWSSYLTVHASQWLAATAPLSGGAEPAAYRTPDDPIPVLLTWGGESDSYQGYSFHDASVYFSEALREDGHFVVECEHSRGHSLPPWGFDYAWSFLAAHPKDVDPEPWLDALPADLPEGCRLP